MEDLIKEEEFLPQINKYDYWKYFRICYMVSIGILFMFTAASVLANLLSPISLMVLSVSIFILPLLVIPVMIFKNKNLKQVPFRKILFPVYLLFSCYYIPLGIMSSIGNGEYTDAIFAYLIFTLVPMSILLLIFRYRQKKFLNGID